MTTHTDTTTRAVRVSRILPAAFGLFALTATQLTFAQVATDSQTDKPKPKTDEVVEMATFQVTGGFAGSLAAAAEMKQESRSIVEVIAAEDIGKLPDISIAESLTRLPGVTTQRLNGRAQAIVIRGMNGDFSTALLNGRAQVSSNAGRSVEFDQYPAELLNSVVVYKSTDASLVGQGLAGTVDLRTVRPLDQGKRAIAANAFYEWTGMNASNAGAKKGGMRETFSYIDQYNGGTVGLAIGVSISDRPGQGEQFNAWGYDNTSSGALLGGAKPFVRNSQLKRDGYMAVLEFKPSKNFHSTLDLYYSKFMENQLLRGIELPLSPNWGTGTTLKPGFTVSNGLITQATLTNFFGVVRNDFVKRDDHLFAGGWNLSFGEKTGWQTDLDLSTSRISRTDFVLETYSGFGVNKVGTPDTMSYTLHGEGGATFTSALDYTNGSLMKLGSPQGWGMDSTRPYGQMGFLKGPIAKDEITEYKIKTQHPMTGIFSRFEAGLDFNKRSKSEVEAGPNGMEGYFLQLKGGVASAPMPASVGVTDLSFIGIKGMYSYDPMAAYNSGLYTLVPNNNPAYMSNNWAVDESVVISYAKFDIDRKVGSIPVTGNLGLQVINTDQTSHGQSVNSATSTVTQVKGEHKYTDLVPSFNMNFHFNDSNTLRVSIARQLARQPMVDMRAGSTYSFNQALAGSSDPLNSPWSSGGGNPKLEPWRSNSYDLSFEQYFKDHMGYWAIAAFHKDLVSYTYYQNKLVDFTGLPTGVAGVTPKTNQGYSNSPQNGQGGYVRGIEFALSLPGEKFTDALKGFGVVWSASLFRSSIQPELGNPSTPLPGLSERVITGTVYYERAGFSARVSSRYRSSYRGDIATFGPRGAVYRNLQPETIIDAQVSYAIKKGSLKGLTFIAQAYNLTDEPLFASSGADTRYVQDYQRYGPSYSIGASYKF